MKQLELKVYITILLFYLLSCQTNSKKNKEEFKVEKAHQWLVQSIESYFEQEYPEMDKITTPTYYQYKTDAINVGLDDGLTETQFHSKWNHTFNTQKAGIGEGFLIPAQDWAKIRVDKISFISASEDGYWFQVVLKDDTFNASYKRNILVSSTHLIANVEE